MQNVAQGNNPSYSLSKAKNQFNDVNTYGEKEIKKITSQLEEVFSKLDQLELTYNSCMTRYRSSGDTFLLKHLSSLEDSKRDLEVQRDVLSEKLLTGQKRLAQSNHKPEKFDLSDTNMKQNDFRQPQVSSQSLEEFDDRSKRFRTENMNNRPNSDNYDKFSNQKPGGNITNTQDKFRPRSDISSSENAFQGNYHTVGNQIQASEIPNKYREVDPWYGEELKDRHNKFSNQERVSNITYIQGKVDPHYEEEYNDTYDNVGSQEQFSEIPYRQRIDPYYEEETINRYSKFSNQEHINKQRESRPNDVGGDNDENFKNRYKMLENQEKANDMIDIRSNVGEYYEEESNNIYWNKNQRQLDEIIYIDDNDREVYEEESKDKYKNYNYPEQSMDKTLREKEFINESQLSYNVDYVRNNNHIQEDFNKSANVTSIHKQVLEYVSNIPNKDSYPGIWSMDVYSYVSSRTLNKRKFVNPASLLGSNGAEFRRYNYTYFNDQPSEDVQIFEYGVEATSLDTTSVISKIADSLNATITTSKKIPTFPIKFTPLKSISNATRNSTIVHINDIISRSEDTRHVIILRGLPGSGKSSFCQSFKEKELSNGHSAPRILSIDHFFMEDGKYEYDQVMEPTYRAELFKMFKRQIDEGFFSVILVDSINDKVEHFNQFYYYAKMNRFQTLVLDLKVSPTICAKRSEYKLNPKEIYQLQDNWEETPTDFMRLDATSFLQDSAIEDVEMEDAADEVIILDSSGEEDEDEVLESGFFKSKWDEDFEDTKERLDGRIHLGHEENVFNINDFLKVEEDEMYKSKASSEKEGEKTEVRRVKWADFEELKRQKKRKELGFVAGYTDWSKIMGDDIAVAEAALVQVRHFVKD